MSRTSFLSGVVIAAAGVVSLPVVHAVGAQSAPSVTAPSAVVQVALALPASPTPRVIAQYAFTPQSGNGAFPYLVTVADSAGTLVAQASVRGHDRNIPLMVTIMNADLVLQGLTDEGVLTLVLDRQHEGGGLRIASGRWMLGRDSGTLRAK